MHYHIFKCATQEDSSEEMLFSGEDIVLNLISLLISFYAAYLSWSCNVRTNTFLRIFYAFFAFMFGLFYLIFYFIFRSGDCKKIKKDYKLQKKLYGNKYRLSYKQ
jgi:hypothetical protein